MSNALINLAIILIYSGSVTAGNFIDSTKWSISVIPSSVRLDPVTSQVIENRFVLNKGKLANDILAKNWVYDGSKVSLKAARGEYISFQLVISNEASSTLRNIHVKMTPFKKGGSEIKVKPELFLEWSVNVLTPSTGYAVASLGEGWYPDALIPLESVQMDSGTVHGRWVYPLWIPDFNNRIPHQKSAMIWVDQFVPFKIGDAPAGNYSSLITVQSGNEIKTIPVELTVWNFAIANENKLKASLQEEGFLSNMDEKKELEVYQLFKRNRVALMDPTYKPSTSINDAINWKTFDNRLKKYFTGKAFTAEYGYKDGPGYGEPLETFVLPFDVYGKHGTYGWPNTGKPDVERQPANKARYEKVVREVRTHLQTMVDPHKTELIAYLNGLDESYFQSALERMVFYGDLFHKNFPEANFRIDGGYSEEAMKMVGKSINAWASHTINYDSEKMKKYQQMGIKDWLYGPMLYESKVNSWVGSSTITDLPLLNERAISWACWKYQTYSWISWGIGVGGKSGWYDPETWKDQYRNGADSDPEFNYKKINGSALLMYAPGIIPNVKVFCPSIRLKNERNGVQEYEYMRLLKAKDKNDERVNKVVNEIIGQPFGEKSIGKLDVWSFDAEKWDRAREKIGEMVNSER